MFSWALQASQTRRRWTTAGFEVFISLCNNPMFCGSLKCKMNLKFTLLLLQLVHLLRQFNGLVYAPFVAQSLHLNQSCANLLVQLKDLLSLQNFIKSNLIKNKNPLLFIDVHVLFRIPLHLLLKTPNLMVHNSDCVFQLFVSLNSLWNVLHLELILLENQKWTYTKRL